MNTSFENIPNFSFCYPQLKISLKTCPDFRGYSEKPAKPQSSIGSNCTFTVYNLAYAARRYVNRAHRRDGHLFKGRFKAILVEKESHLLELCRYIVLNPVRAGITAQPEDYRWSSYLPTLGRVARPSFLATEWLLGNFSTSLAESCRRYRHFVKEGMSIIESPWEKLAGQILLGTEAFVQKARGLLGDKDNLAEIPRIQRHVGRPPLDELFSPAISLTKGERNRLIHLAHGKHGYTLKEISQALGIHYTTVSKVINRQE